MDATMRRMCAVNGLIRGLIACPSEGDVREDVRIAMEAYCCVFGVAGLYEESLVDEAIRLVDEDPPGDTCPDSRVEGPRGRVPVRRTDFSGIVFLCLVTGCFPVFFFIYPSISFIFENLKKWAPASFIYLPDIHGNARPAKTGCDDGES